MPHICMSRFSRALIHRRGLYLLGAGASHPLLPLAKELYCLVVNRHFAGGSFAVLIPHQDERTRRIIRAARATCPLPGLDDDFQWEIFDRLSSGFVQQALRQIVGARRDGMICAPNYGVFDLFPPGVIWNFNLDNLAERWCSRRHRVMSLHGNIRHPFGTEEGDALVQIAQEFDLHAVPSPELMLEPERADTLFGSAKHIYNCEFVCILGYTFGRNEKGEHDDARSFSHLCNLVKRYDKPLVVVDPFPEITAGRLAEKIKSKRVYQLPIYWNVFATALLSIGRGNDVAQIRKAYDRAGNSLL